LWKIKVYVMGPILYLPGEGQSLSFLYWTGIWPTRTRAALPKRERGLAHRQRALRQQGPWATFQVSLPLLIACSLHPFLTLAYSLTAALSFLEVMLTLQSSFGYPTLVFRSWIGEINFFSFLLDPYRLGLTTYLG
jgi:hypothetical protein